MSCKRLCGGLWCHNGHRFGSLLLPPLTIINWLVDNDFIVSHKLVVFMATEPFSISIELVLIKWSKHNANVVIGLQEQPGLGTFTDVSARNGLHGPVITQWRDLGGAPSTPPPPSDQIFLNFMQFLGNVILNCIPAPPLNEGWRPPLRKILDPPL